MYEQLEDITSQLSMFSAEDSPAKTSQWLETAKDWLESDLDCGSSSNVLLARLGRELSALKTSPAYYPITEDGTLLPSFEGWSNSGMACAGGFLTVATSEYPNDADVCSLSEVLETDVPPKYYLSAKACAGILRRAAKRGKQLPPLLERCLRTVAGQVDPQETATS